MGPSHAALEQAVAGLKARPGTFQRLVEEYAGISHPALFPHLVPSGRRSDDVPVAGWPDAWALTTGGVGIVEATHSERWEEHLAGDVARAEAAGRGSLAAFLFAAWAGAPAPARLLAYRRRLEELGVPAENVFLVFREQLVRDLAQPRFARVWAELLGLPVTCLPFDWIDEARHLFGSEEQAGLAAPRRSEYRQSLVHRPALAGEVERRLAQVGWALVRGRGAAGKTVLAISIALDGAYRGRPVYYLDLADLAGDEGLAEAAEVLATHGDPGVLFVVDNVHLEPRGAGRLFDAWRSYANGSHLLLLGRLTTPEPDHRGRGQPLEDLDREALELLAGADDLLGVYRRLIRRRAAANGPAEPPAEVLARWVQLFAGDLLAFSAAVSRRLGDLAAGRWELQPEDAQGYVKAEYLEGLSAEERETLGKLAILAQIEMAATFASLGGRVPARSVARGLVLRTEHGRDAYVWFRLVHPGLGDLLLAALPRVDPVRVLCELAAADSFCGIAIASRLRQAHREEARTVLQAIADSPTWFSSRFFPQGLRRTTLLFTESGVLTSDEIEGRLLPHLSELTAAVLRVPVEILPSFLRSCRATMPRLHEELRESLRREDHVRTLTEIALRTSLGHLASFLQQAKTHWPELYEEIRQVLRQPTGLATLTGSALLTPLAGLSSFLQLARMRLPEAHDEILRALREPPGLEALAGFALRTPLTDLASFLQFARTRLPEAHDGIRRVLGEPEGLATLAASALRAPLDHLAFFLTYAQSHLPEVHDEIQRTLRQPQALATLAGSALHTPLDHLAFFLQYARIRLPEAHQEIEQALSRPENLETLVAAALRTSLDHLAFFLEDVKEHLGRVHLVLQRALVRPENLETMAALALRTRLEYLAPFLACTRTGFPAVHQELCRVLTLPENVIALGRAASHAQLAYLASLLESELGPAVTAVFERASWDESWAGAPDLLVGALPSVTASLARLGRPELRHALVRRAMDAAHRAEWRRPDASIYTLASVLRVASELAEPMPDELLDSVATKRWLEIQYQRADIGPLAPILFSLWAALDRDRLARFATPRLLAIVKRKLYSAPAGDPASLTSVLNLLGAGTLLGLDVPPLALSWLGEPHLAQALATRMPNESSPDLTSSQVLLWLGLREVARKRRVMPRVPAEAGEVFLRLWREAAPANEKLQRLNRILLAWLERCAAIRWALPPDWKPLP